MRAEVGSKKLGTIRRIREAEYGAIPGFVSKSTCHVRIENPFPVVLLEMAIAQLTVLSFEGKLGSDESEMLRGLTQPGLLSGSLKMSLT